MKTLHTLSDWFWDIFDNRPGCVAAAFFTFLIALIVAVGVYSNVHKCHGNGHYYWTTQCVSTGKSVSCYPVRQEEIVCDKP